MSRHTTAVAEHLENIDRTDIDLTAKQLFEAIDRDGDGTVDALEFESAYKSIKSAVQKEHAKERELEDKIRLSKRRVKLCSALAGFSLLVIVMLLAGNAGLVYMMMKASRETFVTSASLVDRAGHTVQTAQIQGEAGLIELVASGNLAELSALKEISYIDHDFEHTLTENTVTLPTRSMTVVSWSHAGDSPRAVFYGPKEEAVLVDNRNVMIMGTPNGYATNTYQTDAQADPTELQAKCASSGCPAAECSARTYHGKIVQMLCAGHAIWSWPSGVTLPPPETEGRRKLGVVDNFAGGILGGQTPTPIPQFSTGSGSSKKAQCEADNANRKGGKCWRWTSARGGICMPVMCSKGRTWGSNVNSGSGATGTSAIGSSVSSSSVGSNTGTAGNNKCNYPTTWACCASIGMNFNMLAAKCVEKKTASQSSIAAANSR